MAIWQFDFDLVTKITTDELVLQESTVMLLKEKFGIGKSWSEDLKVFGSLERTCIKIWYENDMPSEVICRLDMTSLSKEQLDTVIEFANQNNLCIEYGEKTFEPTVENLKNLILNSAAYRFAKNPREFFNNLDQNIDDNKEDY